MSTRYRVLEIADDKTSFDPAVARLLEKKGYDVDVCFRGAGSFDIDILAKTSWDLVIVDVKGREIDGEEPDFKALTSVLAKAGRSKQPIIFLTATSPNWEHAFSKDSVEYLTKPVDHSELFKKVLKLLREHEHQVREAGHEYRPSTIDELVDERGLVSRVAAIEARDLGAKLRLAFLALVLLAPLGATLTSLGVPRPFAAVLVFGGLALLFLFFVVGRLSESADLPADQYERQLIEKALRDSAEARGRAARALALPTWADVLVRLTSGIAQLFSVVAARTR